MAYKEILFDLDGTLTDPKPGITKSVQFALQKFGISVEDLDELIPYIGPPLVDSFPRFHGLSHEDALKAIEYYREYFGEKGMYDNRVYDGILELLQQLRNLGKKLAVASTKPTHFVQPIADHFQLSQYFDQIVGANMDNTRKDKVDLINYVLSQWGADVDRSSVVMIGDREHDIIGAKLAGVDSIGVMWGYGSREELVISNPTFLVETVDELQHLLINI